MSAHLSSHICNNFKQHQLRPEKCRNCFGDKSKHQPPAEAAAQQVICESNIDPSRAANDSPSQDEPTKLDEANKSQHDKDQQQQQQSIDLRRADDEKLATTQDKAATIESYEKEIEKLKLELEQQRKLCAQCESLKAELGSCKSRCQCLELERDQLKEELKCLEREMEEMHDTFKEEESEQFEQTKQELDQATKNCKILQIRLHKSERQYNQLEQVKSMLEQQLEEANQKLQQEPTVEQQQQQWQQQWRTTAGSNKLIGQQSSIQFAQMGADFVKLSTNDYDQLLKDLSDTIEREKDLQEQIKYSQEEAQLKSDRLQAIEAENEVLLNKVNKLTLANSRLRVGGHHNNHHHHQSPLSSSTASPSGDTNQQQPPLSPTGHAQAQASEIKQVGGAASEENLIQQNEQLKLALELAQSECDRLKGKLQESANKLDSMKVTIQSSESKQSQLEAELSRLKSRRLATASGGGGGELDPSQEELCKMNELVAKLEFECRQLRTKLIQSERENRQLKSQFNGARLMSSSGRQSSAGGGGGGGESFLSVSNSRLSLGSVPKAHSMELPNGGSGAGNEQARYREINRQLREQCDSLREQNQKLEQRLELCASDDSSFSSTAAGQSNLESNLVDNLKRRLDFSESELAKVRSRLVEMDLECSRVQRQHKRLVESLDSSSNDPSSGPNRRTKLPPESMRESMSRQELRQALRELEDELEDCFALLRAKDCLIMERALEAQQQQHQQQQQSGSQSSEQEQSVNNYEEQVKSLRRLLEQERLLSNNLKLDVSNLEECKQELLTNTRMLERERVAMEEELDKLRSLNMELNTNNDDLNQTNRTISNRFRDLQINYEKVRVELGKLHQLKQRHEISNAAGSAEQRGSESPDMLLMARDLSELKVKNGFLMRQLEIAREENQRQMEDLKSAHEIQQRRAVELAQIELRERHLADAQQLRDELNDVRQKLAHSQRLISRHEEEMAAEREKLRSMEREWRRERGQCQQKIDQLEGQLSLERRSNEFRVKEFESSVREKEREVIGLQDRCVQLERDLKRTQNKYCLLEENGESKQRLLTRELESKRRELADLLAASQAREEDQFEQGKRFASEKATLNEALESLKRSYDEKLAELKSTREVLALRHDQSFKERMAAQEKLDELGNQLIKMSEFKAQAKLMEQQLRIQEKQLESIRRDNAQLKEDRLRLKSRCDELETRCKQYEKQELISKTSNISGSGLFSRAKSSLSAASVASTRRQEAASRSAAATTTTTTRRSAAAAAAAREDAELDESRRRKGGDSSNNQMIERLTSKINDQRHLINMLKEQYESAEIELKQMKLVQSSEKSRWQSRISQLQSRLNECEEKLLFETALSNQVTIENCRRNHELKWAQERAANQEIIQQQQQQNEILMKDLKKISQAHDLLRLHSKQLEANNNKLSKKLIEYQQQQQQPPFGGHSSKAAANSERQLGDCLAEKRELIRRQAELSQLNGSLLNLIRDQVKPLVETVNKIMAAIESSSADNTKPSAAAAATNLGQRELAATASATAAAAAADEGRSSTLRPLMTSSRQLQSDSATTFDDHDLIESSSSAAAAAAAPNKSTGQPAASHQHHSSRLTRLFASGKSSPPSGASSADQAKSGGQPKAAAAAATKSVKKVRVKSAALGMTPSEKRQLKERLSELTRAIDELTSKAATAAASRKQFAVSNEAADAAADMKAAQSRVHWQLDNSDLDSERSWSMQSDLPASASTSASTPRPAAANLYRRFPQTTPSSHSHRKPNSSLTDYESDASMAGSENSLSLSWSLSQPTAAGGGGGSQSFRSSGAVSGVESDSCMAAGGALKLKSKRRGLKTRLGDTLRNISRSITGLTSDSENESVAGGPTKFKRKDVKSLSSKRNDDEVEEIRV